MAARWVVTMPEQRNRPGGRSQADSGAFVGAGSILAGSCLVCGGTGVADEAALLGAVYRLWGGEYRRPPQRRLSEERRRELANKLVGHGMPTEAAARLFRIAPKVVA